MINTYNNQIINDLVLARMLNLQRVDTHLLIYLLPLIYTSNIMINCKYNNQIMNDLVLARMLNLQRIDTHPINLSIFVANNFYYDTNCLNLNPITIY